MSLSSANYKFSQNESVLQHHNICKFIIIINFLLARIDLELQDLTRALYMLRVHLHVIPAYQHLVFTHQVR